MDLKLVISLKVQHSLGIFSPSQADDVSVQAFSASTEILLYANAANEDSCCAEITTLTPKVLQYHSIITACDVLSNTR